MERCDYYVYLHRRKGTNEVFYVGKGRARRSMATWDRNKWWKAIVAKAGYYVEYVERGLTEYSALTLEVETIKFYRECGHTLCNLTDGGEGVSGLVRRVEITDGVRINLSIYVPDRVREVVSGWPTKYQEAICIVSANLLDFDKVYYSRSKSPAVKGDNNVSGMTNDRLVRGVDFMAENDLVISVVASVTDRIKFPSSVDATDAFRYYMGM